MSRKLIDTTLARAKELGIRNILALRGDAPRSDEYRAETSVSQNGTSTEDDDDDDSNRDFTYAVDLVRYIKQNYADHFCIGVAGYPEGHADESHPEHQNTERDLPHLIEKVRAGADFIMTQLFYDVNAMTHYEDVLRNDSSGCFKDLPIIPGLMPIQSYQVFKRTANLSHAKVPANVSERIDAVKSDDEAVKRVGVDVLVEMISQLKSAPRDTRRPMGFHFYTLNLEKAVAQIIERSEIIVSTPVIPQSSPQTSPHLDSAIADDEHDETADGFLLVDNKSARRASDRKRRVSCFANSQPENRVIVDRTLSSSRTRSPTKQSYEATDDEAGVPSQQPSSRETTLAISEGQGALGREATWDDFPNGRWGDARSPAYGEIDGYGVSLHMSIASAQRLWGRPVAENDLTRIFERHVNGQLDAIPWSEEGLNPETETIRPQLLSLINKGWWTVASQPAVNGVQSTDPVFGWGPPNGLVFQKAFVEFFIPFSDMARLRKALDTDDETSFFAANAAGEFLASDQHGTNAVTWGAFAGKEIVTPTIIEAVSFRAYCEEAFGIWREWQTVYGPASPSAKLLAKLRGDLWLVNVIHHGFPEKDKLWDTLIGA